MKQFYALTYAIEDVEASSPDEAVRIALAQVRNKANTATWEVHDEAGETIGDYHAMPDGSIRVESGNRVPASSFRSTDDGMEITLTVQVSIPVTMLFEPDGLPTWEQLKTAALQNFRDHPALRDPKLINDLAGYVDSIGNGSTDLMVGEK
jgi:hypothetical protein